MTLERALCQLRNVFGEEHTWERVCTLCMYSMYVPTAVWWFLSSLQLSMFTFLFVSAPHFTPPPAEICQSHTNVSTSAVEIWLICGGRVSGKAAKLGIPDPLSTAHTFPNIPKHSRKPWLISVNDQSEAEDGELDSRCIPKVFRWYTLSWKINSETVLM